MKNMLNGMDNGFVIAIIGAIIVSIISGILYYRSYYDSFKEFDTDKLLQAVVAGLAFGAVAYLLIRVIVPNLYLF